VFLDQFQIAESRHIYRRRRNLAKKTGLDGRAMLYGYLQHDLQNKDVWLFQMLVSRLVVSMGVWFCPEAYTVLPIALPFAMRHPLARGNKKDGAPDQWGAPTDTGHFMDDNTLVKNLVQSLPIFSESDLMDGATITKGFVASHVWMRNAEGQPSARDPLTYSFLPNVLWLPSEVSKLTDRAGFTQEFIQAVAGKIYREVPVQHEAKSLVDIAWSKLPAPSGVPIQGLPEIATLNMFRPSKKWLTGKIDVIAKIGDALVCVAERGHPEGKVFSSRYTEGLPNVLPGAALELGQELLGLAAGARDSLQRYPY